MTLVVNPTPGQQSLYIDGYLQFDQSDERLYHESLALPALHFASSAKRILICGGGDGLLARECLRFPGVEQIDLVDYSSEVLHHAETTFSELNHQALSDPRLTVHCADALEFIQTAPLYDVILCDFTFPTNVQEARVFSVEWFQSLRSKLREGGTLAINAVSPQATPKAFACILRTLRAAGFSSVPYRVCLPSFRQHGYGVWGFVVASQRGMTVERLKRLRPKVETEQADLTALWRGARFDRNLRRLFRTAPVSTAVNGELVALLKEDPIALPSVDGWLEAMPAHHPLHTPEMVQTLAEQVAGSFTTLDLRRLVEELWKRAARLPERIREELARLREFVRDRFFRIDDWSEWAGKVFATLLLVMIVANSLAPDNAYGKGSFGLGHASFSRGFSSVHATSMRSTPIVGQPRALSGTGFRRWSWSDPVDVYGYRYRPRYYSYGYGYHNHYYGRNMTPTVRDIDSKRKPVQHKAVFVADDDLVVLDDGSVVVNLSESAYLLVREGTVTLYDAKDSKPVAPIYAQLEFFKAIQDQIAEQRATVALEIDSRKDWLAWVGWTAALSSEVRDDQSELKNLRELDRLLVLATKTLGTPPESNLQMTLPQGAVELFVGCCLSQEGNILVCEPGDKTGKDSDYRSIPVNQLWKKDARLAAVVQSVLEKMIKELDADVTSSQSDLAELAKEEAGSKSDLAEYQSIQQQNPSEPDYEVDYGTDSVTVGTAIARTQQDLADIENERRKILEEQIKSHDEAERMRLMLASLKAARG